MPIARLPRRHGGEFFVHCFSWQLSQRSLLLSLLPTLLASELAATQINIANKIAPWVIEHTAYGQQAEFFVVLADQADLSAATVRVPRPIRAALFTRPCGTKVRPRKVQFCNGCANATLSISLSTLLMQFW